MWIEVSPHVQPSLKARRQGRMAHRVLASYQSQTTAKLPLPPPRQKGQRGMCRRRTAKGRGMLPLCAEHFQTDFMSETQQLSLLLLRSCRSALPMLQVPVMLPWEPEATQGINYKRRVCTEACVWLTSHTSTLPAILPPTPSCVILLGTSCVSLCDALKNYCMNSLNVHSCDLFASDNHKFNGKISLCLILEVKRSKNYW